MLTPLPNIGKPARQALETVHITELEQIAQISKEDLLKLHGVGPKAVNILIDALKKEGLSLSDESAHPYQPDFLTLGDLKCDNAPKRRIIRDLLVAIAMAEKKRMAESASQDIIVTINGKDKLNGLEEFSAYVIKQKKRLSSLELISILSHGKYGACDGVSIDNKGDALNFATFFTFENTKKDALIKEMRLYN